MVSWFGIFSWCTLSLRVFHRDTKLGDGGASQEFFGSKNLIETFRRGKMDFFLANNSCRWIIKTFSCHAEVFLHFSENFYILGRRAWPRRGNFLNFFSPTTPGETWVEFFRKIHLSRKIQNAELNSTCCWVKKRVSILGRKSLCRITIHRIRFQVFRRWVTLMHITSKT